MMIHSYVREATCGRLLGSTKDPDQTVILPLPMGLCFNVDCNGIENSPAFHKL
jgi:hypothetical protein